MSYSSACMRIAASKLLCSDRSSCMAKRLSPVCASGAGGQQLQQFPCVFHGPLAAHTHGIFPEAPWMSSAPFAQRFYLARARPSGCRHLSWACTGKPHRECRPPLLRCIQDNRKSAYLLMQSRRLALELSASFVVMEIGWSCGDDPLTTRRLAVSAITGHVVGRLSKNALERHLALFPCRASSGVEQNIGETWVSATFDECTFIKFHG